MRRRMLRAAILAVAACTVAACDENPAGPQQTSGGGSEGQYTLTQYGDWSIPHTQQTEDGCTARIESGTLTLDESRYGFAVTVSIDCEEGTDSGTMRQQGGWTRSGSTIRFEPDPEGLTFYYFFKEGTFEEDGGLRVIVYDADEEFSLRFRRK